MRLLIGLVFAVGVLAIQQNEQYPGQSTHQEPPVGWMCQHQNYELSIPVDHACSCERMIDKDGVMHEDSTCSSFCHADHCACGSTDARGPK